MPLELQRDLIESAKSGGACLGNLIAAIWPEAYRIALSILHDDGLAQDAAQDACSSIARSLKTLKNVEAFHAWGYRIIVNHAISVARQNPRAEPLTKVTHCPIQFDHSEALDLYNALAELSPVQRGAIVLYYYAGLNSVRLRGHEITTLDRALSSHVGAPKAAQGPFGTGHTVCSKPEGGSCGCTLTCTLAMLSKRWSMTWQFRRLLCSQFNARSSKRGQRHD